MEYLRGGLQAELKQETGPWTIVILKTSNIIILLTNMDIVENMWMLTLERDLHQKVLISGFQRSCI